MTKNVAAQKLSPKNRADEAARLLESLYPDAQCSLKSDGEAWRLLVMARLSAQCTDERVNEVCVSLFRAFPTARAMADAPIEEIEKIISDKYGGIVPDTMEELLALPGVGRKIANLVLGDVYGKGGIVADTHCMRICARLGFYPEGDKDPLKTEKIMEALIAREKQSEFCHRLVIFGRDICTARSPSCGRCPLRGICLHYENIRDTDKPTERTQEKQ